MTPQNNWEERFEEEAPLAYGGREWAKNFIREALASQRETLAVSLDEKAEEYKLKKRETPFQDTLFNHAVNVLTDAAEIVRKFKG